MVILGKSFLDQVVFKKVDCLSSTGKLELEVLVRQRFNFCNFFLVFKKMSAQEVEYKKAIFLGCYKTIENIHSIESWLCIYHQDSDCQLIKVFIKGQKRYYYNKFIMSCILVHDMINLL